MAKTLHDWIEADVQPFREMSMAWLSQHHFFRDPMRPTYSDLGCFFSPADGVILYQRTVRPEEYIVEIKGRAYSLRDAGDHVKAGIDPIIKVTEKMELR